MRSVERAARATTGPGGALLTGYSEPHPDLNPRLPSPSPKQYDAFIVMRPDAFLTQPLKVPEACAAFPGLSLIPGDRPFSNFLYNADIDLALLACGADALAAYLSTCDNLRTLAWPPSPSPPQRNFVAPRCNFSVPPLLPPDFNGRWMLKDAIPHSNVLEGQVDRSGRAGGVGRSPILKLLSPRRHYYPRRTACRRVAMFDQLGLRFGTLDARGVKSRLVVASDVPRAGRQAHLRCS